MPKKRKTKYRKKNGSLTNKGKKKYTGLKKTITELERAIGKRTGKLRTCDCQQQTDLQAEISYLKKRLTETRKKLRRL